MIEGCPDLYQRVKTLVRIHKGGWKESWIYVRPDCDRKTKVESVAHTNATAKRAARDRDVQAFADAGFPVYSGQSGSDDVGSMIDKMVADCIALDALDPDRQV